MSSPWTHAVCSSCYAIFEPGRTPVRLRAEHRRADERCCQCGAPNEGIYYRRNPAELACDGVRGTVHIHDENDQAPLQ